MKNKPYFFCYSHALAKYLSFTKGFKFICEAKNKNDDRMFWLFERTNELNRALTEYGYTKENN